MAEVAGYLIKSQYINGHDCPICNQRLFQKECKFCDYFDGIAVLDKKQARLHKHKLIL